MICLWPPSEVSLVRHGCTGSLDSLEQRTKQQPRAIIISQPSRQTITVSLTTHNNVSSNRPWPPPLKSKPIKKITACYHRHFCLDAPRDTFLEHPKTYLFVNCLNLVYIFHDFHVFKKVFIYFMIVEHLSGKKAPAAEYRRALKCDF